MITALYKQMIADRRAPQLEFLQLLPGGRQLNLRQLLHRPFQ
jgi:hypothetical protein